MDILIVLITISCIVFLSGKLFSLTEEEREAQKRLRDSERRDVAPEEW